MIELEKTFLAKELPDSVFDCENKEIIDIYLPASAIHPILRLRKNGDKYEMTKKIKQNNDASKHEEQTIILSSEEFEDLAKHVEGKRLRKIRYNYPYKERIAEFDIFKDDLEGLVVVDIEFSGEDEKDCFQIPEFCLSDVTKEDFIAGGMLCGKKYEDIEDNLEKFSYKKIIPENQDYLI